MGIIREIFSWWGGNTWSNRVYTVLRGRLVGTDDAGNRYYLQKKGVGPLGVPRRWVIYKNLAEASQLPPEWHAWMHYLVDTPPSEERYVARPWQKPHLMNMTGTPQAYRPSGSILATGKRPARTIQNSACSGNWCRIFVNRPRPKTGVPRSRIFRLNTV